MKSCAEYIAAAKAALGDPAMSDRVLGERLGGYTQQTVNKAKSGALSDPMAMRIAEALGIEPGEVLMVARVEREKDPAVRTALTAWAGNVFSLMPSKDALSGVGVRVAKSVALPLLLASGLQAAPSVAEAAPAVAQSTGVYIMLTIRMTRKQQTGSLIEHYNLPALANASAGVCTPTTSLGSLRHLHDQRRARSHPQGSAEEPLQDGPTANGEGTSFGGAVAHRNLLEWSTLTVEENSNKSRTRPPLTSPCELTARSHCDSPRLAKPHTVIKPSALALRIAWCLLDTPIFARTLRRCV